jgi:hypothetical protein
MDVLGKGHFTGLVEKEVREKEKGTEGKAMVKTLWTINMYLKNKRQEYKTGPCGGGG